MSGGVIRGNRSGDEVSELRPNGYLWLYFKTWEAKKVFVSKISVAQKSYLS